MRVSIIFVFMRFLPVNKMCRKFCYYYSALHDANILLEGYRMSLEEFTEIYVNASEEVRAEIEEILNSLVEQPVFPG